MNQLDTLYEAIAKKYARDKAICALRRSGMTLQAIGKEYGLTRERIRQIVQRVEQEERENGQPTA